MVGFVNDLLAKQREQEQRKETSDPFPTLLSKRILAEAERDTTALRLKAKNEAAAEASQIIANAKVESEQFLASTKKDAKGQGGEHVRTGPVYEENRPRLTWAYSLRHLISAYSGLVIFPASSYWITVPTESTV